MGAGRKFFRIGTSERQKLEAATTLELPFQAQKVATSFDDSLFGDLFAEPHDDTLSDASPDEVAKSPTARFSPTKRLPSLTPAAALSDALPEESQTAHFSPTKRLSSLTFAATLSDALPEESLTAHFSPTKRLSSLTLAAALSDALPEESLTARFSALSFDPALFDKSPDEVPKRVKSPTNRISGFTVAAAISDAYPDEAAQREKSPTKPISGLSFALSDELPRVSPTQAFSGLSVNTGRPDAPLDCTLTALTSVPSRTNHPPTPRP